MVRSGELGACFAADVQRVAGFDDAVAGSGQRVEAARASGGNDDDVRAVLGRSVVRSDVVVPRSVDVAIRAGCHEGDRSRVRTYIRVGVARLSLVARAGDGEQSEESQEHPDREVEERDGG